MAAIVEMSDKLVYNIYYKRHLPHYQPKGGIFFITYRLAFTLPKALLEELREKKRRFNRELRGMPPDQRRLQEIEYNKILFGLEDRFLDNYDGGPRWLSNETIAQLVIESLLFNHQRMYQLSCCLVMSNHVHVILKPILREADRPYALAEIMKNHKSYTAHEANRILERTGKFWHHESYDHYVRSDKEFSNIVRYILDNPVKAGLVERYQDWKYYWLDEDIL